MDSQSPDDVRLDLGEGPSTPTSTLQATVRIRPITIRFTEPGVPDLRLPLHSVTSLRPLNHPVNRTQTSQQETNFIFDLDDEQSLPPPETTKSVVGDVVTELSERGLTGDESVRAVKERMGRNRDGVKNRRLRLIHAGRILRDGMRLVGYLEELDLRARIQRRGMLRHLALDKASSRTNGGDVGEVRRDSDGDEEESERSEAESEGEDDEEAEKDVVETKEIPVREFFEWLTTQANSCDADQGGASSSYHSEHQDQSGRKGKGKSREPSWYDDLIRLTIRTAPTVYLQCSVGEIESQSQLSPTSPSAPLPNTTDLANGFGQDPSLFVDPADPTNPDADRHRGFNRLLDAGLSPTEISSIRSQFRSTHPLSTPYDLIQSREHSQHLLEMEESWMDNFTSTTAANPTLPEFGEGGGGGGAYMTVFQGLMVGFFVPPLIPLFWFRDKAHPSSIPSTLAEGAEEGEEDDEAEWERERGLMTRESVFGATMQVAILFGVVANLIMGVFRFIW